MSMLTASYQVYSLTQVFFIRLLLFTFQTFKEQFFHFFITRTQILIYLQGNVHFERETKHIENAVASKCTTTQQQQQSTQNTELCNYVAYQPHIKQHNALLYVLQELLHSMEIQYYYNLYSFIMFCDDLSLIPHIPGRIWIR